MRTRGRRALRVGVATLVALVLGAVPGSAAPTAVAPTPGTEGIGDAYFPQDGNGGIDVLRYDVRNRYDLVRQRLGGRTVLTVRATQDLSRFNLDLVLGVRRVRVDGRDVRFVKTDRHELQVIPDRPIAEGERFRVVVSYVGRPGRVRWDGERPWVADRHEIVTMGQPHIAAWWFPANDHPLDRARMDVRITTDRSLDVIANGRRVGRTVRGPLATTHWRSSEPMIPYLAFFAIGDFRVQRGRTGGIPWLIAVSERLLPKHRRSSMRQLRRTGRITSWLQRQVGEYPFSSTGGLVTSVDVDFALENQTRPTYPRLDRSRHDTWLVVHELAHQWFGNSVAVHGWRDIWLNEGFATYFEWQYAESRGRAGTGERLRGTYRRYRDLPGFWRVRVDDPGAGRIFHDAVYLRGAMTLAALRERIGRAAFRTLVRTWYAEHRGGNVTTSELTALAERVSGEDLDGFFRAWLRAPRPPARTVANGLR